MCDNPWPYLLLIGLASGVFAAGLVLIFARFVGDTLDKKDSRHD